MVQIDFKIEVAESPLTRESSAMLDIGERESIEGYLPTYGFWCVLLPCSGKHTQTSINHLSHLPRSCLYYMSRWILHNAIAPTRYLFAHSNQRTTVAIFNCSYVIQACQIWTPSPTTPRTMAMNTPESVAIMTCRPPLLGSIHFSSRLRGVGWLASSYRSMSLAPK